MGHNTSKRNPEHLLKRNAESFQLQTAKIEQALNDISDQVDLFLNTKSFSQAKGLLTFKNIATKASVSRTSLFNSEQRKDLIDKKIKSLRARIQKAEKLDEGLMRNVSKEIEDLKLSLKRQREETQIWFRKYQEIKIQSMTQEKTIERLQSFVDDANRNNSENSNLAVL